MRYKQFFSFSVLGDLSDVAARGADRRAKAVPGAVQLFRPQLALAAVRAGGVALPQSAAAMYAAPDARLPPPEKLCLVPVLAHVTEAQLYGIARLKYRPRTAMTAAWWAELHEKGERLIELFGKMGRMQSAAARAA